MESDSFLPSTKMGTAHDKLNRKSNALGILQPNHLFNGLVFVDNNAIVLYCTDFTQ